MRHKLLPQKSQKKLLKRDFKSLQNVEFYQLMMILKTFDPLKLSQSFVSFAVKDYKETVRNGCLF